MASSTPIELASEVSKMLKEALEAVKADIIQNMSAKNRNASGRSIRSLVVDVTGSVGDLYGSASFMAMETGRKAGRVPKGFHKIIEQWIKDKGIALYSSSPDREPNIRSVAYFIARKIASEGTMLHRRGMRQDIYTGSIEREVTKLSEKLLLRVGSDITTLHNTIITD